MLEMKRSAALLAIALWTMPCAAVAAGNPANGAKLYLQCRACHTVGAADKSGVGPNLYGVVGAKAASKPGYSYSPALSKKGIVWTPATLDAFLTKPMAYVPGTKMAFGGVVKPEARADIIAFLATLKSGR
jgi:cytochrome c